jgi:hypothetical protein
MMSPTPNPTPTANAGIAALAPKATPQQVPQQAGGGSGDLMEMQSQLRNLPADDPRTMQLLTSYANGANPMVPQFLALGEIKRREQLMQQPTQPPQGTVKDKVEQSANTMAMQQAKQQQAMQMLAGQAAQAPGPVPQGIPQPAVNMAGGGVTALPVRDEMFNYAGGGIVAFKDRGLVEDNYDAETQARGAAELARLRDAEASPAKPAPSGNQAMQVLMDMIAGKSGVEMPMSPEARRAQMMQSNPEIATALNTPQGQDISKVLDAINLRDTAAREAFKKRESGNQLDAISSALIAAGRGTAGRRGGIGQLAGALGGAGESLIGANAAANDRAIKQETLEREQDLAMGKLREEQAAKKRASAEGRVGDMAKHDLKIAELQQLLEDNQRDAAKSIVTDERTRSEGALNRANQLEASRISSARAGDPNVQNAIRAIKEDETINRLQKDIDALNKMYTKDSKVEAARKGRQIAERQNEIYRAFKVDVPPVTIEGNTPPPGGKGGTGGGNSALYNQADAILNRK